MGRRINMIGIAAEQLKAFQNDPELLDEWRDMLANRELEDVSLDKSLDGIVHVLYGGVEADHEHALGIYLHFSVLEKKPEAIPVYFLPVVQVRALHQSLAAIDAQRFEDMIDLNSLIRHHVYPDVWDSSSGYNGKKYLADHYVMLKGLVDTTVQNKGVLLAFVV